MRDEYDAAIAAHADPKSAAEALWHLNSNGLLTPENRTAVLAHANPESAAAAWVYFYRRSSWLSTRVLSIRGGGKFAEVLKLLKLFNILTQENFNIVMQSQNLNDLTKGLNYFHVQGYFAVGADIEAANPVEIIKALEQSNPFPLEAALAKNYYYKVAAHLLIYGAGITPAAAKYIKSNRKSLTKEIINAFNSPKFSDPPGAKLCWLLLKKIGIVEDDADPILKAAFFEPRRVGTPKTDDGKSCVFFLNKTVQSVRERFEYDQQDEVEDDSFLPGDNTRDAIELKPIKIR